MTAAVRTVDGIACRSWHVGEGRCEPELGRPAALIAEALQSVENHALLCMGLGLPFPCPWDHDDIAPLMAMNAIGVSAARIVRDGSRWRLPIAGAFEVNTEGGFLLPVGSCGGSLLDGMISRCLLLCGDHEHRAVEPHARVSDIIALPFAGGRALSLTGATAAVGNFAVSDAGTLTLCASGAGWIKRHATRARAALKTYPPHQVSRFLPLPDESETLILEPAQLEWRVTEQNCVVPQSALRVACVDSPGLAQFVDTAMKRREVARKPPAVLAPKRGEG